MIGFRVDSSWREKYRGLVNWNTDAGDASLIPGWGRSPGKANGNPLQYSCLGSPMNRGVWQATVRRVTKESDTT